MKRIAVVLCTGVVAVCGGASAQAAPPDASAASGCNVVRLLDAARATGQPLDPGAYVSAATTLGQSQVKGARAAARTLNTATTPKRQARAVKAVTKACNRKLAPLPLFFQGGSGNATTASFHVPDDWDLSWHFDCGGRYSGQGSFVVTIYDADSDDGSAQDTDNQGTQQLGKNAGSGTDHYHSGGNTKFLEITSLCAWDVVVTRV